MGKNLMQLAKTERGGVNLALAEMLGPNGMKGLDVTQGYHQAIERLCQVAGLNTIIQVNDCETSGDWTESSNGVFDYTVGATGKRVGTNNLYLTNTAATNGTQYIQTILINESAYIPLAPDGKRQMSWEDTDYIGFWKHAVSSAHFGTDGELQFAIVNDGVVSDIQDVDGTSGTTHHWCQIDIRGMDRDKVEAIRFYATNTNAAEVANVDDIIRYKFQYNGGPMYGSALPIKSATTLSENDWSTWSIDGCLAASSAAAVTDVGPALLNAATRTGTAARSQWAHFPGCFFYLAQANAGTIAGEGLEWAANGLAAGVSTGVDEKGFAKGHEAAGAQYDWIFVAQTFGGNFIS